MYDFSYTDMPFDGEMIGVAAVFLAVWVFFLLLAAAYSVLVYVLQSLGMYTIAKRRGIRHPWLSWIPVGNAWILGSISDQYQYVAKGKVRSRRKVLSGLNIGLYAFGLGLYIWYVVSLIGMTLSGNGDVYYGETAFAVAGVSILVLLAIIVLSLVLTVLMYVAYNDLFESCDPGRSVLFLVLSILFSFLLPFFVFACRKKDRGMPPKKSAAAVPVQKGPEEPASKETYGKLALPDKMYAFAGQPIKLYFLNITEYASCGDVTFKADDGGKGTVYSDRWEYTPQAGETIVLKLEAYDRTGKLLAAGSTVIVVKDGSEQKKLSVLVIGDSTIAAGYETQKLLELAQANDYPLTLLGSYGDPHSGNRYEGRSGWSAGDYVLTPSRTNSLGEYKENAFLNPQTGRFDFSYYMEQQEYDGVDCVVLQLGINDVFSAQTDEELKERLSKLSSDMSHIINSIHSYDPQIKIVRNLILPGSVEQSKFEAQYGDRQNKVRYKRNTYLTNLEILKEASGTDNVYIAYTNAALDVVNNMASGGSGAIHPAAAGYMEIGAQLYGFIRAIN